MSLTPIGPIDLSPPLNPFLSRRQSISMADPNFPPNLDIRPLVSSQLNQDAGNQKDAITQYGIAGRIWYIHSHLNRYN